SLEPGANLVFRELDSRLSQQHLQASPADALPEVRQVGHDLQNGEIRLQVMGIPQFWPGGIQLNLRSPRNNARLEFQGQITDLYFPVMHRSNEKLGNIPQFS